MLSPKQPLFGLSMACAVLTRNDQPLPKMLSPKSPYCFGFGDGVLQRGDGQRILAADVEESLPGADGVGADQHAFEDGVRIAFQNGAVHVRAGRTFVGVANDVLQVALGLPGELPFLPGGEGRPAAAAEPERIISSITSSGFICVMARIAPRYAPRAKASFNASGSIDPQFRRITFFCRR